MMGILGMYFVKQIENFFFVFPCYGNICCMSCVVTTIVVLPNFHLSLVGYWGINMQIGCTFQGS